MKKITFLLLFVIGFWSINAQNQRIMSKEQERNMTLRNVKPVTHHYDHLRSPNANVVLNENFNSAALPAGWTVVDNSTGGAGPWTFVTDYSGNTLDGTPFAMVDSDGYGQSVTEDTELVSPVVDISALGSVFISFDQYYNTYTGADIADVDVYDGTQWVNVFSTSSDMGAWGNPDHQLIDVTAYKNANFQVRFHYYNANWEWYWAVDNVMVFEPSDDDLAVIDAAPGTFVPNAPFVLKTKVYNNGLNMQDTFDVTFDVKDASNTSVFNETINITGAGLAAGGTHDVSAVNTAGLAVGTYTVEVTVTLAGDQDTSNDTYSTALDIIDYGSTYSSGIVYSYVASDMDTSGDADNTVSLDMTTGASTALGNAGTADFLIAGTFVKNILVGVEYGTNNLYFIDGTTGAAHKFGTFTGDINVYETSPVITGIAYDSALDVGYVCTPAGFYTFDYNNLNTTFVGAMNNAGGVMIGMDVDNNGNVYGIDLGDDQLYSIDPTTGAATAIGALGIDISYAQDMGADPVTGNLYGTLYQAGGAGSGLYSIDKVTGAATLIGTAATDEYSVCAIFDPSASVSENHIAGLKVYPNPTNGMIAVNADENIQNITIVNLAGQVVKTFDNDGSTAQLDLSDLAAGNYILKITTDQTVGSYQIIKK